MYITKSVQPKLVKQLLTKILLIYSLNLYQNLKLVHEELTPECVPCCPHGIDDSNVCGLIVCSPCRFIQLVECCTSAREKKKNKMKSVHFEDKVTFPGYFVSL